MVCEKCNDFIEKDIELNGRIRRVKRICKCKAESMKERERIERANEKRDRLKRLLKSSLMEKNFYDKRFVNWDFNKGDRKYYDLGTRYVENFKEIREKGLGMLLYGSVGMGKSYLSFSIGNSLLDRYVPVVCISINGLLDRIKETYNRWGSEGEGEILRAINSAELLIIDDLGVEKNTDWSVSKVYDIIDSRYRNKLPIIITTNYTIDDLREKYGERTTDRICEMCINVEFKGNSLRRGHGRENINVLRRILYNEEKGM